MARDQWVCIGGEIAFRGSTGDWESRTVTSEGPSEAILAMGAGDYTMVMSDTAGAARSNSGALLAADDYNTWCEYGTTCHRVITDYIAETKGNGAWGDGSGVLGQFDTIIRTNLDGRRARWTVTEILDGGPGITWNYVDVNCREDQGVIKVNCGKHRAITNGWTGSVGSRTTSPLIYGNWLYDSNDYYAFTNGRMTPSGYSYLNLPSLNTLHFNCFGTGNCYFP